MQGIIGTLKLFVITTTKKVQRLLAGCQTCHLLLRMAFLSQRFLSWHGRVGPLIYVLVLVTYLSGVMSVFEPGNYHHYIA